MTLDDATKAILRSLAENMERNAHALTAMLDAQGSLVQYYDVPSYCQRFGGSPSTIRRHCAEGRIEGARKRGGQWVVPVREVTP